MEGMGGRVLGAEGGEARGHQGRVSQVGSRNRRERRVLAWRGGERCPVGGSAETWCPGRGSVARCWVVTGKR